MSTTLSLGSFIGSLVAVGLFAGLITALIKYEWDCPVRVAGTISIPAVIVGYIAAHGLSAVFGVAVWTTLGGVATLFCFVVLVFEAGQSNSRAGL